MLVVELVAANVPAGHCLQEEAPTPAAVPGGHTVHEMPEEENEPSPHREHHAVLPPSGAWPGGHLPPNSTTDVAPVAATSVAATTVSSADAVADSGHAQGLASTVGAAAARE